MIGVIAQPGQRGSVEEFFELFKTPWLFYGPGSECDVIISSGADAPQTGAKLVLESGPEVRNCDARLGIGGGERRRSAMARAGNTEFPIYGEMRTFPACRIGTACVTAGLEIIGLRVQTGGSIIIRLGYDLFGEIARLLSTGQPAETAHIPTLDIHIRMLRQWILEAGLPILEIPPMPTGRDLIVCLTHDIDFVGIRRHVFDHSMWGFVYRATVGALARFARGRLTLSSLARSFAAAASLPFVYLGWAKDFWEPFEWHLKWERELPTTYFLIPFKGRAGANVPGRHASRRAAAYDIGDVPNWTRELQKAGSEIGAHGIDAWHDAVQGRRELERIAAITGRQSIGIRIHWLLRDEATAAALDEAGYSYDSTAGYNETAGFRAGTTQAYRPLGAQTLLELPLHIQDGALFYPQRMNLTETEAEKVCGAIIEHASECGGVVTVLWHDRSHAPERFWGDFYLRLLQRLKSTNAWFATAGQAIEWFRARRAVRFEPSAAHDGIGATPRYDGASLLPSLQIRVYRRNDGELTDYTDVPLTGASRNAGDARPVDA